MSAFRHPHNTHVRPLEEELAEMGLNPDKVLSEIDRNTAMLEGGPVPFDLAGLHEGSDDVPRSISQYGSTLLDEKKCKGGKGDDEDDEDDEDDDEKDDDEKGCTGAYDKGGEGKKGRGRGMGVGQGKGPIGRRAMEDDIVPGSPSLIEKKWIQQAIKDPGRVREYLGVPEGEKIPAAKLNTAIEKLKAVEDKSDEQKSLLSALVLAKRLKSGDIGESLDESVSDVFIDEGTISDALYLINEGWELTEVFQIIKKARGAEARLAKRMRHRKYLMHRGAKKLAAKIFRRRFKRKIKRVQKRKEAKFGKKGLSRLHQMGRRVVMRQPSAKKEWSEALSSITEELERDTASVHEDASSIEEAEEPTYIVVEVLVNAATTAMYLGEIFDAIGDDAGQVLFQLSEKAVDLADLIEANGGEPTEEQEGHVETVLEAVIRALKEHEDVGSPSLGEAIGMAMVAEGLGTWEELVEYTVPSPTELQQKITSRKMGAAVMPLPTVAGKYLKAINMAMQKMDPQAAIKAAEVVAKKHKVVDSKGLPVPRIENMTDVLRVVFYLSQITGLKAPAWMYIGKQKPWFVSAGEDEVDAKMVAAMKALGASVGSLKAMGEEFEHIVDFVWSLEEAGMGAHSVIPGLDPDQERIFDTIVLMATNDGASYKKKDANGAVKKAAMQHKRDAATDLAFDLKKIEPFATKEVARRWSEAY